MTNFNYGENLRILRQRKGISQEAMAMKLNISQTKYSRMERRSNIPDDTLVKKIAEILCIPVSELLPPLEELNCNTMGATHGSGKGLKASELLVKPTTFIIKIALALALAGVAYDAAGGASSALEVSDNTSLFAKWTAALAMMACFYNWLGGFKI
jgi:transcriptional regulator with XRE-family HTH domain